MTITASDLRNYRVVDIGLDGVERRGAVPICHRRLAHDRLVDGRCSLLAWREGALSHALRAIKGWCLCLPVNVLHIVHVVDEVAVHQLGPLARATGELVRVVPFEVALPLEAILDDLGATEGAEEVAQVLHEASRDDPLILLQGEHHLPGRGGRMSNAPYVQKSAECDPTLKSTSRHRRLQKPASEADRTRNAFTVILQSTTRNADRTRNQ